MVDAKLMRLVQFFTLFPLLLLFIVLLICLFPSFLLSLQPSPNEENKETFDFAFVDADKQNNKMYHEKLMRLVKVGGIIAYDNTLWGGTVVMPESEVPEYMRLFRESFIEFNKILALDPRIEISHLPAGDGITFCKRLY